ncbi:MAG: anti-sigma factor [Edaphobacter sp.]
MSEPRRITSEDLTMFAMQLLSPEEHAEVAAYLERSPDARQELAEINGELAIYAHTVDLHTPPAQTRERLMKQIAREKKAIPIDRPAAPEAVVQSGSVFAEVAERINRSTNAVQGNEIQGNEVQVNKVQEREADSGDSIIADGPPKRGVAGRVLPWIGWAVAAGLALVSWNLYHERDNLRGELTAQMSQIDQLKTQAATAADVANAAAARQVLDTMKDASAMRVTLTTYKAAQHPTGRTTYVASKGALIFLANDLGSLPPEKTYELWLIPAAEGQSPIPAGTFRADERGNASVIMPPLPKGVDAKGFAVTIEPQGGSTTPTMPLVLSGE